MTTGDGVTLPWVTSDLDLRERRELCDLFDHLGATAPTLCGDWTTADLAAHLVVRERDPLGAPGILISPLEGLTEKRMAAQLAKHGFEGTVERVRTGPPFGPMKIPAVRYAANLVEFFVHHEDVRRANGGSRRGDRPDLDEALWALLSRMAPLMVRRAKLGDLTLCLRTPTGKERVVGSKGDRVVISGPPGELVLELYGRSPHADVSYEGPQAGVDVVRSADFGI